MAHGCAVYEAKDVKELSPDTLAPNSFGASRDVRCAYAPLLFASMLKRAKNDMTSMDGGNATGLSGTILALSFLRYHCLENLFPTFSTTYIPVGVTPRHDCMDAGGRECREQILEDIRNV